MLTLFAFASLTFGRVAQKSEPFTEEEYWTLWKHFQSLEGFNGYMTHMEHNKRYDIFKSNMEFARDFNEKGEFSFTLGVTTFADMTKEEFEAYLDISSKTKPSSSGNNEIHTYDSNAEIPAEMDWVSRGAVTPIKNQGQCGSCWAFSTTGGIEGQNFLKTGTLSSFSEQELVDCSKAEGNQGCDGGLMDDGFKYVEESGLCFEDDYPYEGADGSCRKSSCTEHVMVKSFKDIAQGDTDGLKNAIGTVGPVSIAVDANFFWQMYTGGVFDKTCNKNKLDHGVLAVGYGSDGSDNYWKVKNSWGAGWGENGYIRLAGYDNTCGLANSASYPVL